MSNAFTLLEAGRVLLREEKYYEAAESFHQGLTLLKQNSKVEFDRQRAQVWSMAQDLARAKKSKEAQYLYRVSAGNHPDPGPEPLTCLQSINKLRKIGLLKDATPAKIKALAQKIFDKEDIDESTGIIEFLYDGYYADERDGARRRLEDKSICLDWKYRAETNDVVRQLADLVGEPLFTQQKYEEIEQDNRKLLMLHLLRDDGQQVVVEVKALGSIVELFNDRLKEMRSSVRFYALNTESDFYIYYLLDQQIFKKLLKVRDLPFESAAV